MLMKAEEDERRVIRATRRNAYQTKAVISQVKGRQYQ
jgi:hypothetical protein